MYRIYKGGLLQQCTNEHSPSGSNQWKTGQMFCFPFGRLLCNWATSPGRHEWNGSSVCLTMFIDPTISDESVLQPQSCKNPLRKLRTQMLCPQGSMKWSHHFAQAYICARMHWSSLHQRGQPTQLKVPCDNFTHRYDFLTSLMITGRDSLQFYLPFTEF